MVLKGYAKAIAAGLVAAAAWFATAYAANGIDSAEWAILPPARKRDLLAARCVHAGGKPPREGVQDPLCWL